MKKSQTRYAQTVSFFHTTQRFILRYFYKFSQATQNQIFSASSTFNNIHSKKTSLHQRLYIVNIDQSFGGSVTDFHASYEEHQRGFRNFGCASDGCVALFERSEFAKAVINRRTAKKRKRKLRVLKYDA